MTRPKLSLEIGLSTLGGMHIVAEGTKGRSVSLTARVATLEQDSRAHARSLTELTMTQAADRARLEALENWRHNYDIIEARKEERDKAMTKWMGTVEKDLQDIQSIGKKILWIVGAAVIGAFVTFVLKGGGLMP